MTQTTAHRRAVRAILGTGAFATLALPMAAHAGLTGYLKLPDIDGESKASVSPATLHVRKDSGEVHLDYLVITLNAKQGDGEAYEPGVVYDVNAAATAEDDHSAGDEHEITYDIAAGAFAPKPAAHEGHEKWIPVEGISYATGSAAARPADTAHGSRLTGIRSHKPLRAESSAKPARQASGDAASGLATGKRQHKPMTVSKKMDQASPNLMRAAARWSGCSVGARYPHIVIGDGQGSEYRLEGVEVKECAREHVSFAYKKVVF